MSAEDQEAIAENLEERRARRRRDLGLDQKPAEPISESLGVETVTRMCACGRDYSAQRLSENGNEMFLPPACELCREAMLKDKNIEASRDRQDKELREAASSLRSRMAALNPPPLFATVSLENFQHHGDQLAEHFQMRVLSWARRYLAQWPDVPAFSVFLGNYGTGKGHVSWALARYLVEEREATARVIKVAALVRQLRDTWRNTSGSRTYEQVLADFTNVDFLVLDEASRHAFYGQQIHQHLYDVIDTRIEYRRPTILTSNEDAAGLEEVLRPALMNRLQGEGGVVPFGTASWRSREVPAA